MIDNSIFFWRLMNWLISMCRIQQYRLNHIHSVCELVQLKPRARLNTMISCRGVWNKTANMLTSEFVSVIMLLLTLVSTKALIQSCSYFNWRYPTRAISNVFPPCSWTEDPVSIDPERGVSWVLSASQCGWRWLQQGGRFLCPWPCSGVKGYICVRLVGLGGMDSCGFTMGWVFAVAKFHVIHKSYIPNIFSPCFLFFYHLYWAQQAVNPTVLY